MQISIGIYSLGAGNRGLVRAIEAVARDKRPVVIAHELTDTTRAGLQLGVIDAVLNQDAGHEVRSAIRVLKAKAMACLSSLRRSVFSHRHILERQSALKRR